MTFHHSLQRLDHSEQGLGMKAKVSFLQLGATRHPVRTTAFVLILGHIGVPLVWVAQRYEICGPVIKDRIKRDLKGGWPNPDPRSLLDLFPGRQRNAGE